MRRSGSGARDLEASTSSRSAFPTGPASRGWTGSRRSGAATRTTPTTPTSARSASFCSATPTSTGATPSALGRPRRCDAALDLPPAEDVADRRDLGRNGTYLVFRQLHQDVRGSGSSWADGVGPGRAMAACRGHGYRTRERTLVPLVHDWIEGVALVRDMTANHFTYAADPHGERCPIGAHIRRANPRTGDVPPGTRGWIARLVRALVKRRVSARIDRVRFVPSPAAPRCAYGERLSPEEALQPAAADEERGLHFIHLAANLSASSSSSRTPGVQSTKFPACSMRPTRCSAVGRHGPGCGRSRSPGRPFRLGRGERPAFRAKRSRRRCPATRVLDAAPERAGAAHHRPAAVRHRARRRPTSSSGCARCLHRGRRPRSPIPPPPAAPTWAAGSRCCGPCTAGSSRAARRASPRAVLPPGFQPRVPRAAGRLAPVSDQPPAAGRAWASPRSASLPTRRRA